MSLKWWENSYIAGKSLATEPTDDLGALSDLTKAVARGSYVEALKSSLCQEAVSNLRKSTFKCHILESFNKYLSKNIYTEESCHVVLCCGVSALQLFVQNNFTGPMVGPSILDLLPSLVNNDETEEQRIKDILKDISEDTEGVYGLLKYPEYLLLARIVFVDLKSKLAEKCFSVIWWNIRFCVVLQKIADEFSGSLYDCIQRESTCIEESEFLSPDNRELISLYFIEAGQAFLLFGDVGKAAEKFNRARTFLRLKSSLTGSLGKRTKHQQDAKPQLIVKVEYDEISIPADEMKGPVLLSDDLPKDLILDDDTRLHCWKFMEQDDDVVPNLTPLEQIGALLTDVQYKKRSRAQDIQDIDETRAYLRALLQFPKCWVIQYCSLRFRSKIESTESRAVTRARLQFEELVESIEREVPSRFERLKLFYASDVPCSWEMKTDFGDILFSIGETKTALNLFEGIKLWENVIDCYNRLQMRSRSAEIIRDLLSEEETPKLLCLLGDAIDDITCYEKAWEVSNGRSSRSQRSLGDHYFLRKDYVTATSYFKKSIEVSHIQIKVWERLAYCGMQLKDWKAASIAYKKCTVFEPDQFEYWNNLGSCYTHTKEHEKAHKCFKETARLMSNSWKVFQNLVFSSISCDDYSYALYAYKRFYDLTTKENRVNPILLEKMATGFLATRKEDNDDEPIKQLHKQYLTFFSGLCQKEFKEFIVWYEYGELLSQKPDGSVETRDLAFQKFRRCLTIVGEHITKGSTSEADKNLTKHELISRAIMVLLRTEQALTECIKGVPSQVAQQTVRSFMFSFNRFMVRARNGFKDVMGNVVPSAVKPLEDGDAAIERIEAMMATLETSTDK